MADGVEAASSFRYGYDKYATVYRGALVRAAALLWINDAPDDLQPAKLEVGEELLVPRLHPWAHGSCSRADGTAVRGATPLRERLVRPQWTIKGLECTHSLSNFNI